MGFPGDFFYLFSDERDYLLLLRRLPNYANIRFYHAAIFLKAAAAQAQRTAASAPK